MRLLPLVAAIAAAFTLAADPAVAGSCCDRATVVYGVPPLVTHIPPPGYHRAPVRIADQGPVLSGPGVHAYHDLYVPPYARPTYWEGGYAIVTPDAGATPFPYVRKAHGPRRDFRPFGVAPLDQYPYRRRPWRIVYAP